MRTNRKKCRACSLCDISGCARFCPRCGACLRRPSRKLSRCLMGLHVLLGLCSLGWLGGAALACAQDHTSIHFSTLLTRCVLFWMIGTLFAIWPHLKEISKVTW